MTCPASHSPYAAAYVYDNLSSSCSMTAVSSVGAARPDFACFFTSPGSRSLHHDLPDNPTWNPKLSCHQFPALDLFIDSSWIVPLPAKQNMDRYLFTTQLGTSAPDRLWAPLLYALFTYHSMMRHISPFAWTQLLLLQINNERLIKRAYRLPVTISNISNRLSSGSWRDFQIVLPALCFSSDSIILKPDKTRIIQLLYDALKSSI